MTLTDNRSGQLGAALGLTANGSTLTLINDTLSNNSAYFGGGGLYFAGSGDTITITNCTIANNTAGTYGGGIYLRTANSLFVTSSTITGNTATGNTATGSEGRGGSMYISLGTVIMDNTIVSGNSAASSPDIWGSVEAKYSAIGTGGFVDLGHNLPAASSTPVALGLQPLGNYGGPTQTVAIASNSSAIGMGDPALNGTTDQRGVTRPHQTGPAPQPDIGAFEYSEVLVPAVTGVQVNGEAAQRSMLTTIAVTFNTRVIVGPGAFILTRVGLPNGVDGDNATVGTISVATQVVNWQTVATLTFAGMNTTGGSLDDGNWTLTVVGTQVTAIADGTAMAADDAQANVKRLFGDSNGDGIINQADMSAFAPAIGSAVGNPTYLAAIDYNDDGFINGLDLIQFRNHIGDSI